MSGLTRKVALLGASVTMSLALVEAALRVLVGPPAVYRYPQERYVRAPSMGHQLLPGHEAFTHDQPVSINSLGIRGPEYQRAVPDGTRRILALGDSQTFGNGLDLAGSWPAQLERVLSAEEPGRRWEVLNAGISATDTWQHAEWLRQISQRVDFDLVILGFYVNDVTPRYETPSAEGLTNTTAKRIGYFLKRSALLTLSWQLWKKHRAGSSAIDRERRVLNGEPDEVVDRGWEEVERSLGSIQRQCQERNVPLLIVVIPRRDQVDGSEGATAYNARIRSIGEALGIPVADMLQPLRDAYARDGRRLFLPWDGHNSRIANDVIARSLFEAFETRLSN